MALTSKSIDEILTLIADAYDGLITPKRLFRNNNNKLWLAFRAIAAGYSVIQDAALSLHSRFDPVNCSDEDLLSTAKIVGTDLKSGSGSLLSITAKNNDTVNPKTLTAGTYRYTSVQGDVFAFTLALDVVIAATATKAVTAISLEKGAFPVSSIALITLVREDLAVIDSSISFSCADNAGSLGYPDESLWDFRQRIINDSTRQDAIKELELAIRNLPSIFECNVVLNTGAVDQVIDGITLTPYQMLIVLSGAPTAEVATEVASRVFYHTKMVNPLHVVNYSDSHLVGGVYPVYYTFHAYKDFTANIDYRFDSTKILQATAEAAMQEALNVYRQSSQRIDTLTEDAVYLVLNALGLTSVVILNVDLLVGGTPVPYIDFPKTRLVNLTAATLSGTDVPA
jgi:hypothetical protein